MTDKMKVKIALGQMRAVQGEAEPNLEKMERMTKQASEMGADIICFPELSAIGYFVKKDRLEELAEAVTGEIFLRLSACAKDNHIYIIAGYAEREGASIYNSCLMIDKEGELAGNARKVHLWKSEKKRFLPGNAFPVFKTSLGKIAIINCYDLEFPEPSRIAALKGAEIIFCPAAWSHSALNRWDLDIKANSLFNILYIAGANFSDELCCGSSAVAGPDGAFLIQASVEEEIVLTAEIDRGLIRAHRADLPYFEDISSEVFLKELAGLKESFK